MSCLMINYYGKK